MMPVDAVEYMHVVEKLVRDHPHAIEADATGVANTMVAGLDEHVDPSNGYVRTHGTREYLKPTLYPADVIAHSEQPQASVHDHWADGKERPHASIHDRPSAVYAIHTLALDLLDAIAGDGEVSDR